MIENNATNEVIQYILSDKIDIDHISYAYCDDKLIRGFVDFTGGLVKEHYDIHKFIEHASSLKSKHSVLNYFDQQSKIVKDKIRKHVNALEEGPYKKACLKLLGFYLNRIMCEKNSFTMTNQSPLLKEYMFFLGMITEDGWMYFDIYQSEAPNFTEMFWLLNEVPETRWTDVTPQLPKSPLSFDRSGKMHLSDCRKTTSTFAYFLKEGQSEYNEGEAYFENSNYQEAIPHFIKAYEKESNPFILNKIGKSYSYLEDYENALTYYEQAIKQDFIDGESYLQVGINYKYMRKYSKARTCFKKNIKFNEKIDPYMAGQSSYYLGYIEFKLGHLEKALKILQDTIEEFPSYEDSYQLLTYILNKLGYYDDVIPTYDKLIAIDPTEFRYSERGIFNHNLGNYKEAIADYTQAISLLDSDSLYELADYHRRRASSYNALNQNEEALKDLNAAINFYPQNVSVCLDYMELLITLNKGTEILENLSYYQKMIREYGEKVHILLFYYLKGLIYISRDLSLDKFIERFKKLSAKKMKLSWSFRHTDNWIETSNMSGSQKEKAREFTKIIKGTK